MSMDLTPGTLCAIADKLIELDKLGIGIEVKVITIAGHDVHLKREGKEHRVIGLTDKPRPHGPTSLREVTR